MIRAVLPLVATALLLVAAVTSAARPQEKQPPICIPTGWWLQVCG